MHAYHHHLATSLRGNQKKRNVGGICRHETPLLESGCLRETEKEADIWRYVAETRRDEQRLSFEYAPYLYYRIVAC